MAVLAFFRRVRGQLAFANDALDRVAVLVDDADRLAPDLRHVAFLEEYKTAGDRQQRGHVRGHEVLLDPQTDDHRAAFAGENQTFRVMLADNGKRVGSFELGHRGSNRLEQVLHGLQVEVNAVRNDLGIGLRGELVPGAFQLLAQLLVILDDSVVHDGEAVPRDVRMGVALARYPMCRPACVGNSDLARGR